MAPSAILEPYMNEMEQQPRHHRSSGSYDDPYNNYPQASQRDRRSFNDDNNGVGGGAGSGRSRRHAAPVQIDPPRRSRDSGAGLGDQYALPPAAGRRLSATAMAAVGASADWHDPWDRNRQGSKTQGSRGRNDAGRHRNRSQRSSSHSTSASSSSYSSPRSSSASSISSRSSANSRSRHQNKNQHGNRRRNDVHQRKPDRVDDRHRR